MKRQLTIIAILFTLLLSFACACDMKNAGPLKSITHPYIAQYECVEAKLGEEDLLKKFDYIKIALVNSNTLELNYKQKNGDDKTITSNYSFDTKTRTLTAEIGLLGCKIKQSTVIENGKFTITKSIVGKQLVMKFKAT